MKFTTKSGIELTATAPCISGKQYFIMVNDVAFQLDGDRIKTVFERSVNKFMASINKPCPVGTMCVAMEIDAATKKELIAFIDAAYAPVPQQSISREEWNNDSNITYHGTHEMWNGVRMD